MENTPANHQGWKDTDLKKWGVVCYQPQLVDVSPDFRTIEIVYLFWDGIISGFAWDVLGQIFVEVGDSPLGNCFCHGVLYKVGRFNLKLGLYPKYIPLQETKPL